MNSKILVVLIIAALASMELTSASFSVGRHGGMRPGSSTGPTFPRPQRPGYPVRVARSVDSNYFDGDVPYEYVYIQESFE
ncbi:unnamed protein product [Hermetia illucens]|uniref:Uncharacterized protein n=1 Tax=Hermetia illucens TaxID=343691 RepID=A0A7R8YL69_HERIL|nr:unnamed protein product [Hermetia illucens]